MRSVERAAVVTHGRADVVAGALERLRALAVKHGVEPRSISFKGALQTLEAFQPLLERRADRRGADRSGLYQDFLGAIATHRVGDRPDRFEPRLEKRRRNNYDWLTSPRGEVKRKMAKGLIVI